MWFKSLNCLKSKASTLVPSPMLRSFHIDGLIRLMILVNEDDASAPERGRYRSLQCWRHCSTAHNRPPKIGSDKDHRGFNPLHFKCLNNAVFSWHGGMIFGPIVLLHWGKFGNKLPEQTKFKWSGLSVSRQVLNCLLMEIFLSSTLNDSPHHRLRTPWRWLCLVWNLIDGWLSLVVWIYQRGSLWMIIISK